MLFARMAYQKEHDRSDMVKLAWAVSLLLVPHLEKNKRHGWGPHKLLDWLPDPHKTETEKVTKEDIASFMEKFPGLRADGTYRIAEE